jgi:biopolymer transport protein TolR
MGMSTGGGSGPMSDINVTPLVDVMLVLLIIFMITAPLLNQGVEVELPRASAQPMEADEDQLVLTIDRDLNHYINENRIPRDQLRDKLAAIAREAPGQQAVVGADGSIPYRHVLALMADAKNAGITKVGLLADPPGPTAADDEDAE